jgi:hypothetical protein
MGYTHYWDQASNITDEQWEKFCNFVRKAIELTSAKIVGGHAEAGTEPEISDSLVSFNGEGENGHETFYISRDNPEWSFCKTAMKGYDDLVVACLVAGDEIGVFKGWSSDGERHEHQRGYDLYEEVSAIPDEKRRFPGNGHHTFGKAGISINLS